MRLSEVAAATALVADRILCMAGRLPFRAFSRRCYVGRHGNESTVLVQRSPPCYSNGSRSYATDANPNPPLGLKNSSNNRLARCALVGARGYTGQALIELFNNHSNIDLQHVSSRELAGQKVKGYGKRDITYRNLSLDDIRHMSGNDEIDCWVMALPNGVCKPYIDAIESAGSNRSVIVDLSADHRFDEHWTYGLPELVDRAKIARSNRISNPGCYATAAQIGIAPMLKYLGGQATIFGVSGYSGAGTKPSPKNDVRNLTDNLIPYSLTDHIHEREISSQLGHSVAFVPHVAVWFAGIHVCLPIPLINFTDDRSIRYRSHCQKSLHRGT